MTSQNEAVCFGIDVSKHWLDIAEHPSAQVTRIDNTAAAIRGWLRTLPRGAQRIACESTGSYHCMSQHDRFRPKGIQPQTD